MPGNDVQSIVGLDYAPFLILYIVFMCIYVNAFYLIHDKENVKAKFSQVKQHLESKQKKSES